MQDTVKKRKMIIGIVLLLIIILIYIFYQRMNFTSQEDLIFFKLIDYVKQENPSENKEIQKNENKNEYRIEILEGKEQCKEIKLEQSIDYKTLVNEKIAPGTRRKFQNIAKFK